MNTKYIYSSARSKALEAELLTETQMELLLSSKDVSETFKVLQDTFVAPYLFEHEKSDINSALDASILDAKKTLSLIAPYPELLDILWIKYDFYNLKAIIKGKRAGFDDEKIKQKCVSVGKYSPLRLISAYNEKKLNLLNRYFYDAVESALSKKEVFEIDITMNIFYFKAIKEIALKFNDKFVNEYVSLLIDLFNLESALRISQLKDQNIKGVYIQGGRFKKKDLENERDILESYKRLGKESMWEPAIEMYKKTKDFTLLEKVGEEYLVSFLKEKSVDMMSPAPLFAYFAAKKNNAQTIHAIMVAKKSGMSERDLRIVLRKLY